MSAYRHPTHAHPLHKIHPPTVVELLTPTYFCSIILLNGGMYMNTKIKKLTAVILSLLLVACTSVFYVSAGRDTTLKFHDGEFKIMVFTDIHQNVSSNGCAVRIMREALDKCSPDLVVLLGDNTTGDTLEEHEQLIEYITRPMRERNIPYTAIFGNHDAQSEAVSKEELLAIYQRYGCLSYDADPNVYGCVNFNLPVMSSDGSSVKLNLWFFDSGADNPDETIGGYDNIRESQIEWYKETAENLKIMNGGKTVPALNFQHIILPEVYDVLYPELPTSLGKASNDYNGKSYSLVPKFAGYTGFVYEAPQPPYEDLYGELDAFKQVGDVMASFSGHDHVNSFVADVDGIDIVGVPTVHNKNYSNSTNRGAGLITVKEDTPDKYEYELIRAGDLAMESGSKICDEDGSASKIEYFFALKFADALLAFQKIVNLLFYGI